MGLFTSKWTGPNAVQSYAGLAAQPYSLLFDSARPSHPLSRFSYICWHPFETIESKNGVVTVTNGEQQLSYKANGFDVLQQRLNLWRAGCGHISGLPDFQGGAAGFFGYDMGRQMEKLPAIAEDSRDMPDMAVGIYDQVLAFDHHNNEAWLMIHAADKNEADARRMWLERQVQRVTIHSAMSGQMNWRAQKDDSNYLQDIQKIIDYIYAGDVYQVNLSRRFSADLPRGFDAFSHYRHLREVNAAPYAAYLNFGNVKIASTSPEQFLSVRGDHVETRPIKGTMPSSRDPQDLLTSDKDRAENIMIVDLLRNDLSKACENHSVTVPHLCEVETFEGLHHLVSTVSGTLREDKDAVDLLKACFPGGSITGCPKIRAMEIIEEMEPQRRGPYCGSIGMIGFDGMMETSISIRTLVYEGHTVSLQTGGGIVADSNPQAELDETLIKAQKMFESFLDSYKKAA